MSEKASSKHMIRPLKAEDWEPYREVITTLYAENTLAVVIEQMKTVHCFSATPKQYKTKIKDWGLATKYVKDFEYEELLNQEEQEEYNVRGKRVSHQDVARFKRRKEKNEGKSSKDKSSKTKGGIGDYYDENAGEGSGGGYAMASDQYVDYSGAGGDEYAAGGAVDYSGYAYDQSGGGVYDPQQQQGSYDQQGSGASGYQQHQGSGDASSGWSY